MTSIFERALGPDFERLHARLRERLSIELERGSGCVASGVMSRVWHGTPLLKPLLYLSALDHLLFPEDGVDVPFTMENWPLRDLRGWEGVSYQRVFELPARRRRFDSVTVLDPASNRLVDQLGAHRLVVADWRVGADDRGGLVIRAGRQRVRVGRHEVPLPAALCATAEVHDWYDEVTDRFRIEVLLSNRVLGTIIGYQGSFTCRLVPAR